MAFRHSPQRLQIGSPFAGDTDNLTIDKLLPTQIDPVQNQSNRRMKPEKDSHQMFRQNHGPVMAADVEQLVTGNAFLLVWGHLREALGN